MSVVLERRVGEAFVIKVRSKDGTEQSIVVHFRKISPSKVNVCISVVPESDSVRIHRIEHFTGEEFKTYLELIEKPMHKYRNILNMCEYNKQLNKLQDVLADCLTEEQLMELNM